MTLKFTPEMFSVNNGTYCADHPEECLRLRHWHQEASPIAQRIFDEWLDTLPVMHREHALYWPCCDESDTAYMISIEPIKECQHDVEPLAIWRATEHGPMSFMCKYCGKRIKASGWVAE